LGKKNKLQKFADNRKSENVIEPGKPIYETIKGNWNKYFGNDHDIIVELACGRGEYTIGLAGKNPDQNFVGIDLKGERIWKGSNMATSNKLTNVAFLRTHITNLEDLFEKNEISEIWLTFPDPRPKERDEKHRLTNSHYLTKYRSILKPEGWFKFKTDNTDLFDYSLKALRDFNVQKLACTYDLYTSDLMSDHFNIRTKYEEIWTKKGESIKYLKFKF
jgi:tRNA (guanine-N7-)-methyltransferase